MLPVRNGLFEADFFGHLFAIAVSVFRPDIEWDTEVAVFLPDLVITDHPGKTVLIAKGLVGTDDALEVVIGKKALRPLAGNFVHRINEEHLVPALLGLVHTTDDDAGLHGRVVKEVGPEAQHTFHHVMGDQLFTHGQLFVTEEDAMRKQDGATAALGLHAFDDVLPEGIVGAALGWRAVDVPTPRIGGPGIAVPLLDGIRWICQHHIELHESVAFNKSGMGQGVASDDAEVLDAVQEKIHAANGRREQIALLTIESKVAPFPVLPLEMGNGREQHARRTACRIVDRLAWFGLEHLGHQVDHGAVGIELRSGMAGIVGELLDQKLVTHTQLILRAVGN